MNVCQVPTLLASSKRRLARFCLMVVEGIKLWLQAAAKFSLGHISDILYQKGVRLAAAQTLDHV